MTLALVTGGSGFIGRHLVEGLLRAGLAVRATCRGQRVPLRARGLEWVTVPDVERQESWAGIVASAEYVYHLAAVAHRMEADGAALAAEYERVNVEGTRKLARAAARSPSLRRLIFVSSVAAGNHGGERAESPPRTAYGRSKLAAEEEVRVAMAESTADWTILRPCLVYGPGNPGNMARLQRLVRTGLPLPLGGVRNRRSFLFIGNLVDALVRCATHPGAGNRTFLVSDGEAVSTRELVEEIAAASGRRLRLVRAPQLLLRLAGGLGDLAQRISGRRFPISTTAIDKLTGSLVVDASEIRSALSWVPPYSLAEGLRMTFAEA